MATKTNSRSSSGKDDAIGPGSLCHQAWDYYRSGNFSAATRAATKAIWAEDLDSFWWATMLFIRAACPHGSKTCAEKAIKSYTEVLADENLPPNCRAFVEDRLDKARIVYLHRVKQEQNRLARQKTADARAAAMVTDSATGTAGVTAVTETTQQSEETKARAARLAARRARRDQKRGGIRTCGADEISEGLAQLEI